MCRRNQAWGFCAVALGLGLLIGCSMESAFWCCSLGVGAIVAGFFLLHKK